MKLELEKIDLKIGKHNTREAGVCVMEAVAWAADLPHTDFPECTDRVIAKCAQRLNDRMPNNLRNELLKPLIYDMIGTKGYLKLSIKRAFIATDWAVRIILPTAFDLMGKKEWADKLRALAPIIDRATALVARDAAREVRAAYAADAAYAAYAYAAAAYAADADAYAADADAYAAYAAADAAARRTVWTKAVEMLKAMIEAK